jgi:hypothetical protein
MISGVQQGPTAFSCNFDINLGKMAFVNFFILLRVGRDARLNNIQEISPYRKENNTSPLQ